MPIPKGIKDEMGLRRIGRSQITACFDGGEVCSDGADAAAWGYEDFNDPAPVGALYLPMCTQQKKARCIINL